jgi:hypothetical protein
MELPKEPSMKKALSVLVAFALVCTPLSFQAQERVAQDVYWKIRQEATDNSQILRTLHFLTDLYGPRLTGSPNLKAAGEWAVQQMASWGAKNGRLEPWDFGHPGWVNERLSAHIVSPVQDALVTEALAWTPGTNGPVRAQAVQLELPQRPMQEELTAYFEQKKDAVRGRIVLAGPHQRVLVTFNGVPLRREDSDVLAQYNAPPPQAAPAQGPQNQQQNQERRPLTNAQIDDQLNEFLVKNGARARVNDAGRDHGQIRAFHNRSFDVAKAVPTVVMRNEDYGRISRLLADGRTVELEFDIVNRTYPEGRTSYNVIAEIPGTDKADEVVMMGGHLDSWHAATGATDNAIGCAVMMEAMRILTKLGVRPRRTIRVALWSGEEQGLLGSRAYVQQHFGTFEEPKPAYSKFAGYFNVDTGTGRPRGMMVFGPEAAGTVLRETVAPLKDLGILGAMTTRSRARGGSDHTSFNAAGLPGVTVQLDPIQYQTYTWHTNLDTYERIVEDDVIKSAIVVASSVYHLAMRDELLPRFTEDQMPRPPQQPQQQRQQQQQTQTQPATQAPPQAGANQGQQTAPAR